MNLNVHIERLILDGVNIPSHEHPVLQAAVAAELTRLLSEGSLHPGLVPGGARAFVPGGGFQVSEQGSPDQLGQDIARAVYGGIGV